MRVDAHGHLFMSVIRNRGVPLFRGSFYTLLYGLLARTAANVRYREVSTIQGSVIEGFQCSHYCKIMLYVIIFVTLFRDSHK